ncbi:MAG: DNA-J related domain-containing protein [Pseudoalteromonas sp.]|uniref:DNA-J related domain-containing protein n=1 Tax=unclassified Pseudoalteromonas TaxID=194690 RepID=UPI003F9723BC
MRDYYLNWRNFETSNANIDELLSQFWQCFTRSTPPRIPLTTKQRKKLFKY